MSCLRCEHDRIGNPMAVASGVKHTCYQRGDKRADWDVCKDRDDHRLYDEYKTLRDAVIALREWEATTWIGGDKASCNNWYTKLNRLRAELDALVKDDTEDRGLSERSDRMTDYDIPKDGK